MNSRNLFCEFVVFLFTDEITSLFLPIEFFKPHKVVSTQKEAKAIFTSSGTSGNLTSRHYVLDLEIYEASFISAF